MDLPVEKLKQLRNRVRTGDERAIAAAIVHLLDEEIAKRPATPAHRLYNPTQLAGGDYIP